jgi:hypothetical protein
MNPQRSIEYLTGFIMGVFIGLGLDLVIYLGVILIKRLCGYQISVSWWMLIPLPLLIGAFMSKAIADLHLEDY